MLGEASAIRAEVRLEWFARIRSCGYSVIDGLVLFFLAIVTASLILFDRSDRVYLVVAIVLSLAAGLDSCFTLANLTTLLDFTTYVLLLQSVFLPLIMGGWMLVWWLWFRLIRPAWVPWAIALLTVAYSIFQVLGGTVFSGAVPHSLGLFSHAASVAVRLLFLPLMLFIVGLGIRKEGREGWLVLPALIPMAVGQFESELATLHIPTAWRLFGGVVFLGQIGFDLAAAAISLLLLRRLLLSLRRQRQMALDVKQAQEVQQVILPEAHLALPGLTIESEYRPAREVGGDFFQIIPHKTDGSLLIVAGDVTGKGLKAGMLVALLVGAVRSTLDWSSDPMAVLRALNKRVMGRADAQATCLALRIESDGAVTLANAGHMPPYLNGELVAMEGALPLGMIESAEFSEMRIPIEKRRQAGADVRWHRGGHRRKRPTLRLRPSARPAVYGQHRRRNRNGRAGLRSGRRHQRHLCLAYRKVEIRRRVMESRASIRRRIRSKSLPARAFPKGQMSRTIGVAAVTAMTMGFGEWVGRGRIDGQNCPRAKIVGRWSKTLLWFSVVVGPRDMHGRSVSSQDWPKLVSIWPRSPI